MGKIVNNIVGQHRVKCADEAAPICASVCCSNSTSDDEMKLKKKQNQKQQQKRLSRIKNLKPNTVIQDEGDNDIKELLVIGAGPHSLSLMLRLLEPEADLMSDKTRHYRADFDSKMRPISEVRKHLQKLAKGPSATLRRKRNPNKNGKRSRIVNVTQQAETSDTCSDGADAPSLSLETVCSSVLVVDSTSDRWLSHWKQNFEAIGIPKLRSLMNAHADPYDHRSLEIYAELKGRDEELVPLPSLTQRDRDFHGPYQVPSTRIFNEFHDLLARGYGIEGIVQKGTVLSIDPVRNESTDEDPLFRVTIGLDDTSAGVSTTPQPTTTATVKARRIVCAMGPMFRTGEAFWEATLRKELVAKEIPYPSHRILHASEIVPFLREMSKREEKSEQHRPQHCGTELPIHRLLIVGGGITSAQLAILAAKSTWCHSVKLIQRSKGLPRHFDIENKWMGPRRGQLLEEFWSLDMLKRAQLIQEARLGGSIPPEILQELVRHQERPNAKLQVQEEVQVSQVHWIEAKELFRVKFDDGSDFEEHDMVWLVTGNENDLDIYSAFSHLRKVLPVDVVGGLPVLTKNLSWRCPPAIQAEEPYWKRVARKRMWCIGSLAGLELGPDALNLVGARQGAVRVAIDVRKDMMFHRDEGTREDKSMTFCETLDSTTHASSAREVT